VKSGKVIDYYNKNLESVKGTAYVHYDCMSRFEDYMTGMGMIPENIADFNSIYNKGV
jgi:hypothetical protein